MTGIARDDVQLLVVMPTRNRADLAATAISSVLQSTDLNLSLLISDNSTSEDSRRELAAFCELLNDRRVHYLRPPTPLALGAHWEWAIQQARRSLDFTHVVYVTDRTIVKRGHFTVLMQLAAHYPDKVIGYKFDTVDDTTARVMQQRWTGKLLEVPSAEVLVRISQVVVPLFPYVPVLANSLVPCRTLDQVESRYGSIFGSALPDLCFGFRCLERIDSFLFYDVTPVFHYALDKSKSHSLVTGACSEALTDWLQDLGRNTPSSATPIPGLTTLISTFVHEYGVVAHEAQSSKLPPIDSRAYFAAIRAEIAVMKDAEVRRAKDAVLRSHAHLAEGTPRRQSLLGAMASAVSPPARRKHLVRLANARYFVPLWRVLQRFGGPEAANLRVVECGTVDAALEHARSSVRPCSRGWAELELYTAVRRLPLVPAAAVAGANTTRHAETAGAAAERH